MTANVATQLQSALAARQCTGARLTELPLSLSATITLAPYCTVKAGDTWASIATALYGTVSVATQLQSALGSPALSTGVRLTGLPVSLSATITLPPCYTVNAGDTWASIATALYGTADVATQLQSALGSPALSTGARLTGLPSSLSATITLAPYCTVKAADTWAGIATALYGTANVATQLQSALGSPALNPGARLTGLPSSLSATIALAPYYTVKAGNTWATSPRRFMGRPVSRRNYKVHWAVRRSAPVRA
jgi:nucleoid-associated protein YgaU